MLISAVCAFLSCTLRNSAFRWFSFFCSAVSSCLSPPPVRPRISCPIDFRIFSFISAAAALLKVTTSISSTEIPSRRISCLMRSVKTAVFPDPAAADTKISLPLTVIASLCSSVQFISFPPLLLSCTAPSFSAGFEKSLRKNFPGMPPACASFSLKDFSFDTKYRKIAQKQYRYFSTGNPSFRPSLKIFCHQDT